jgi:hypothetical protein
VVVYILLAEIVTKKYLKFSGLVFADPSALFT